MTFFPEIQEGSQKKMPICGFAFTLEKLVELAGIFSNASKKLGVAALFEVNYSNGLSRWSSSGKIFQEAKDHVIDSVSMRLNYETESNKSYAILVIAAENIQVEMGNQLLIRSSDWDWLSGFSAQIEEVLSHSQHQPKWVNRYKLLVSIGLAFIITEIIVRLFLILNSRFFHLPSPQNSPEKFFYFIYLLLVGYSLWIALNLVELFRAIFFPTIEFISGARTRHIAARNFIVLGYFIFLAPIVSHFVVALYKLASSF